MSIPFAVPDLIPGGTIVTVPPGQSSLPAGQIYDVQLGGVGLTYVVDDQHPLVRETVPPEKSRIDQAANAGEQTLSSWWLKSQQSFHGGAGQVYLESAFPAPSDQIRFALSKNVDVFTPGRVSRLPDTISISSLDTDMLISLVIGADDALVLVDGGTAKLLTDLDGDPLATAFSGVVDDVLAVATDGTNVYVATQDDVIKLNPSNVATATVLASYPVGGQTDPVLGWVKSRLMLGVAGGIYELDVSQTAVTLDATQLRYQNPAPGFHWRCFGVAPTALLAAGDANGESVITGFSIVNQASTATLEVTGDIAALPVGERVLSLLGVQGSFLAIGTTKGIRIGVFESFFGKLTYGPLALIATEPTIPCNAIASRDRFVYAAGKAYDEGGLIRVDLGTQVSQDGRFAWAPDLIAPVATNVAATAVAALSDGRFAFSIPGTGILLEQVGAGTGREAWLRTSKIRYNTTEPKLFKFGRLRGDFHVGSVRVVATTPTSSTPLITVGGTVTDPPEFRLPVGQNEWLQLQFDLEGAEVLVTSYQVKALPGTRKQYHYLLNVNIYDHIITRGQQEIADTFSAREKRGILEALDQSADETSFQEFTPTGILTTRVVIERFSFTQTSPPTSTSDVGGIAQILLRTVES